MIIKPGDRAPCSLLYRCHFFRLTAVSAYRLYHICPGDEGRTSLRNVGTYVQTKPRQTSDNHNRDNNSRQILKNQILRKIFLLAVFAKEFRMAMRRDAVQ